MKGLITGRLLLRYQKNFQNCKNTKMREGLLTTIVWRKKRKGWWVLKLYNSIKS